MRAATVDLAPEAAPVMVVSPDTGEFNTVLKAVRAERLARRLEIVMAEDSELSVKAIISDPMGRILVLKDASSAWHDLPGGHVHEGEDAVTGLAREVREETGISIGDIKSCETLSLKLGRKVRPVQFFKATALSLDVRLSHEHSAHEWVEPKDLEQYNLGVLLAPAQRLLQPVSIQAKSAEATGRFITEAELLAHAPVSHHETARRTAERIYKAAADSWLAQLQADLVAAFFRPDEDDYDGVWSAVYGAAAGGWVAVMAQAARTAYAATATMLAQDAGVPDVEPPSRDRLQAFARSRRGVLQPFSHSVRDKVRASILRGVSGGESGRALAARAAEVFEGISRTDATRVAATEAQVCYGISQSEALELAGYRFKVWVSRDDGRVRDSHFLCEEQGAIPASARFHNGLMFPGDPNGPPEEVINCRCWLVGAGNEVAKASEGEGHPFHGNQWTHVASRSKHLKPRHHKLIESAVEKIKRSGTWRGDEVHIGLTNNRDANGVYFARNERWVKTPDNWVKSPSFISLHPSATEETFIHEYGHHIDAELAIEKGSSIRNHKMPFLSDSLLKDHPETKWFKDYPTGHPEREVFANEYVRFVKTGKSNIKELQDLFIEIGKGGSA